MYIRWEKLILAKWLGIDNPAKTVRKSLEGK
ncbi:hypothetical protein FHS09_004508 [Microbulbifer rhizosphaerae]|uniref:Uncharacterized protein n=1 Tax=Microbulbifer rhizosphaerae TaxID=1562603 RepID=A0A7W4ZBA6_9GAMM|nr:hypothetical protein [Microbulbifer rhizosphaerae]